MNRHPLLREKREEVLRIAERHGASNVRVFGSAARGARECHGGTPVGPHSDLDVLVALEEGRSLLDQVGLKLDLEDLLGCRVDVVVEDGLYWLLKRRILKEAVPL